MLKQFLFLSLLNFTLQTVLAHGKLFTRIEHVGGGVRAVAYREDPDKGNNDGILCACFYSNSYHLVGWDIMEAQSSWQEQDDVGQANCVGRLEGMLTYKAIYIHFHNTIKSWCKGREQTCSKVYNFLNTHLEWIEQTIKDKADRDPIWHHVEVFYSQIEGLQTGYAETQPDPHKNLNITDFIFMNLVSDLEDVAAALEGDVSAKVRGDTHCSAIIKLLPNNEDLLVGHNTWDSYVSMYRMLKIYSMPLRISGKSNKFVPAMNISFSGYPGVITSGDDFYIASSGLVALETTIGNSNASRWVYVQPKGQLFESVRSLIALRLANNGNSWCKTFSNYNSGTYNNQWMIVDFNKFKKGEQPKKGTLWILEQIPGYIRSEDQTALLVQQSYWPSYNVPFYPDVFNLSGNWQLVQEYGNWFSYNNTARALIFRRDHSKVTDLQSLMALLRSNDYKHDQYGQCNCTPPYSAENALAARSDLNPKDGKYPFPALGHRPHGAIDAKVVSPVYAKNLTFFAVCGPTTGNKLPPFRWNKSDFKHLPHEGQPNSFVKFYPILTPWIGPLY